MYRIDLAIATDTQIPYDIDIRTRGASSQPGIILSPGGQLYKQITKSMCGHFPLELLGNIQMALWLFVIAHI